MGNGKGILKALLPGIGLLVTGVGYVISLVIDNNAHEDLKEEIKDELRSELQSDVVEEVE